MHIEIIANSMAGKGRAEAHIIQIEEALRNAEVSFTIHRTEYAGHAIELARQAALAGGTAVPHILCAAGGDGTINEVVNGLMSAGVGPAVLPHLAVLPAGRGNDFAAGAGMGKRLEDALDLLLQAVSGRVQAEPLDLGRVTGGKYPQGRYFANGVGIGFDTLVGFEAAKFRRVRGGSAYALAALKLLALYPQAPLVRVNCGDHSMEMEAALISIMNGQRMGGAFYMAPGGDVSSGELRICMTRQGRRAVLLSAMMAYARGTQEGRSDTHSHGGNRFVLEALRGTMAVHADGETIAESAVKLEIEHFPGVLRLIRPSLHSQTAAGHLPYRKGA